MRDVGWYFLIYAYPAFSECHEDDKLKRSELEEIVFNKKSISKEILREIFPMAFKRMEEKLGKDYWTYDSVKIYWWVEHNKIIENGEEGYENAMSEHKETCKVKFWEVAKVDNSIIFLKGKEEDFSKAFNYRNISLDKGDYVSTHKGMVIESVKKEDYEKYA